MKAIVPVVALLLVVFLAVPVSGGEDALKERAVYQIAIDDEIAKSRQMASLLTSRSANLRQKGHREASKAMFLETHRNRLVDEMMASNLDPKTYKVDRFLNDRFSCTCYATWAAR